MHLPCLLAIALAVTFVTTTAAVSTYVRGCYFTNWSQYRNGAGKYQPEYYVPGLCTHMMYAFAAMNADFTVKAFEWNDESTDWSKGQYEKVNDLKTTDPQLKTLLSLGGWNFGSTLFKAMSSSTDGRARFVSSVVSFLRKWKFDGFDLDWEYPSGPADIQNYNQLAKELRQAFEAEASSSGKPRFLLTAAVSAGDATIKTAYDIPTMAQYFDYVFVMTYDFHGGWEMVTGENSPLYARKGDPDWQAGFNTDYAARYWQSHGMPKEKIVVGIATYGRGWTLKNPQQTGMGVAATGPSKPTKFVVDSGVTSSYEICDLLKTGGTRFWNAEQAVPYAVKGDQWFGYDDDYSIRNKMRWLKQNGYGGAFVWTLDFDDFSGSTCGPQKFPLISVIQNELAGANKSNVDPLAPPPPPPTGGPQTPTIPAAQTTAFPASTVASVCSTKADGFYSNPSNCQAFILCLQSTSYDLSCPPNLAFSNTLKYCTLPAQSGCSQVQPTGTAPTTGGAAFTCQGRPDGFFADPSSCSNFYRCVGGVSYAFNCPTGLAFNPTAQACDYAANVDCK